MNWRATAKRPRTFTLFLAAFLAFATFLQADDAGQQHRTEQLQAAFAHFPLLSPATNSAGQPEFQTLSYKNPVVIDEKNYYGFRFTVPPRSKAQDFVWATFMPETDYFEWDIVPEHGTMPALSQFLSVARSDYWTNNTLLPTDRDWMIMQGVPGKWLADNQTYLMWTTYAGAEQDVSVALTFKSLGTNGTNRRILLEKALGLTGTMSPPIVNPQNHHSYVLLRPSTWKDAEKQAVTMGGHLATVRNQAENDWLVKTFGAYGGKQRLLWIGLTDRDKKFHFTWSSGESASYTCWAKGEPNNAGRGEDFVAIYYPGHSEGGKWNDWNDRAHDPIDLPMQGVVEIIPHETPTPTASGAPAPAAAENVQAVQILPKVVITSDGGSIKLEWPASNAHYMLEAATDITGPFTMFGYSELTNATDGTIYVTITNPAPRMFFRLSKP